MSFDASRIVDGCSPPVPIVVPVPLVALHDLGQHERKVLVSQCHQRSHSATGPSCDTTHACNGCIDDPDVRVVTDFDGTAGATQHLAFEWTSDRHHTDPWSLNPSVQAGFCHRPDIDGLRAIAVVLVLLFHLRPPGWFENSSPDILADMCFTISGYLMTHLFAREIASAGRVSVLAFYGRRIRRLLPMATLVIFATAVAGRVVQRHSQNAGLRHALRCSSPYHFASTVTDYFVAGGDGGGWAHYWTLCVEVQFYVVWPLAFGVVAWATASRPLATRYLVCFCLAGAVAAASLTNCIMSTHQGGSVAYYSSFGRAWELAAGGMLALYEEMRALAAVEDTDCGTAWPNKKHRHEEEAVLDAASGARSTPGTPTLGIHTIQHEMGPELLIDSPRPHSSFNCNDTGRTVVLGWQKSQTFIMLLLVCVTVYCSQTQLPGAASVPSVALTALMLHAGFTSSQMAEPILSTTWLAHPVLQYIGEISYSLYLWHWPLLGVARTMWPSAPASLKLLICTVALCITGLLAAASLKLVESPIRHHKWLAACAWRSVAFGVVLTVAGAVLPALLLRCTW